MNTRQLHHFLALLNAGSLSAAAETVNLSQPALSRSIRALEDLLGVPLFDRNERRLQPTAYAYAFKDRARRILFEEKEGSRALQLMHTGEMGNLTFGMGSSLAATLLKPIVLDLLQTAPQVKIRTAIESSDRLMTLLLEEILDFFVGDISVAAHQPETTVEPVYRCTFGWYGRRGHPLSRRPAVTFEELKRYPLIATGYLDESAARRFMTLYGLTAPLIDHFALVATDLATVQDIVSSSDAIVSSTDFAMIHAAQAGLVKTIKVEPALDLDMTLGIVRLTGRTLLPAATRTFDIISERFAAATLEVARTSRR